MDPSICTDGATDALYRKTVCPFKMRLWNHLCGCRPSVQPGKADQEDEEGKEEEEEGTGDGPSPPPQQQQQQRAGASTKNKKKKSKKAEKGAAKAGNAGGGGGGTTAAPLPPHCKGVATASSSPQDDIDRIVRELNLSTVRGGRWGGQGAGGCSTPASFSRLGSNGCLTVRERREIGFP